MPLSDLRKLAVQDIPLNFYCNLKVKGIQVQTNNILMLSIKESVFHVPLIDIALSDNGMFLDLAPLEDDDDISLEISKSKSQESVITNMNFKMLDYEIENMDGMQNSNFVIHIVGYLDIPLFFYPLKIKSYPKKTSVDVLKELLQNSGFKVESKVKTNDLMTWLQINQSDYEFLEYIKQTAYISDNDILMALFDRNGTISLTSLLTETNDKESFTCIMDSEKTYEAQPDIVDDTVNPKPDALTKVYFSNYSISNFSGIVNKYQNYGWSYNWYALDGKESEGKFDYREHPLTQLMMKSKKNAGMETAASTFGYHYKESNVHDKWYDSLVSNKVILDNFFGNGVTLTVNPNDKIFLMDKGFVKIPVKMNYASEGDAPSYNETYSGSYCIASIVHSLILNGSGQYGMKVWLCRGGINKNGFMSGSDYNSVGS